jgi:hypothetical protein
MLKPDAAAPYRKRGDKRQKLMVGNLRFGNSNQDILMHRAWARRVLMNVFAHDEDREEIVAKLVPTAEQFEEMSRRKFKRPWVEEYRAWLQEWWSVKRCAQGKYQGGESDRGYDRQRRVMTSGSYNEIADEYEMVHFDCGDGGEGVPLPQWHTRQQIAADRHKVAKEIGIKAQTADGSVVTGIEYTKALKLDCKRKGKEWCNKRKRKKAPVENLTSGDAAQSLKKRKLTHMCSKAIGTNQDDNSPWAMWGLFHWEGGDDWEEMEAACGGIWDGMEAILDAGKAVTVTFGDERIEVPVDQLLTGDGAMLDAEQGGSGFAGPCPCVFCRVKKKDLAKETKSPPNTRKHLNNSSHLPRIYPCTEDTFEPFTCEWCGEEFATLESVQAQFELDLSKKQLSSHSSFHGGQRFLQHKLSPIEVDSTLIDSMHMFMGLIRHQWNWGVAEYIKDDSIAADVNVLLETKCQVKLDVRAVSDNIQKAAQGPRLPGAASKAVAENFPLFLKAVLYPRDNEGNHQHLDDKGREEHYTLANTAMKQMINLHTAMNTEMEQTDPDLPPSIQKRKYKAKRLGILSKAYRTAYKNAYDVDAFAPYTHMTCHLEEQQLRVQYDLAKYSCQAQEHYGKVMKQLVKNHSNFRLGQKSKRQGMENAEFEKSYIQQGAEHMAYRKQLNTDVPVRGSEYSVQKKHIQEWVWDRKQEQRQRVAEAVPTTKQAVRRRKQVVAARTRKQARISTKQNSQWKPHHTPHSKLTKAEMEQLTKPRTQLP